MTTQDWAILGLWLWWIDLALLWGSVLFPSVMHFVADPHPTQWAGHWRILWRGLLRALVVSMIAFFVLRFGFEHLPIQLMVTILVIGAVYYGISMLLTFFAKGFVVLTSWGAFGEERRTHMLAMNRHERGTIHQAEPLAALENQASPTAAVTLRPRISLPREEIPISDGLESHYHHDMVYDEDEDWAASLAEENEDDGLNDLPPLEVYNDKWIQELRETLLREMQEFENLQRQGAIRGPVERSQWLKSHPSLAGFYDWYHSDIGKHSCGQAGDDIGLVLERYLFWEWIL